MFLRILVKTLYCVEIWVFTAIHILDADMKEKSNDSLGHSQRAISQLTFH